MKLPWTEAEVAYLAKVGQGEVGRKAKELRELLGYPYWECKKAVCIARGKTNEAARLLLGYHPVE